MHVPRRARRENNPESVSATRLLLSTVEKHVKERQLESVFATQMFHVQVSYISCIESYVYHFLACVGG